MKRPVVLATLVAVPARLLLSSGDYSSASTTETSIPDSEVTSSASEKDDSSSASATITITWTTVPMPDE